MSSKEFASAKYTVGQLNAMIKIIIDQCGEDGPERFLKNAVRLQNVCEYGENKNVRVFDLTSPGFSGEEWLKRLNYDVSSTRRACVIGKMREFLLSDEFKPSEKGTVFEFRIVEMGFLHYRCNHNSAVADLYNILKNRHPKIANGFSFPTVEMVCMIMDQFAEKVLSSMGLNGFVFVYEDEILPELRNSISCSYLFSKRSRNGIANFVDITNCTNPGYEKWTHFDGFVLARRKES